MYGVPKDIDLTPFLGCDVSGIQINVGNIVFIFWRPDQINPESPMISVEGPWEYRGPDGAVVDRKPEDTLGPCNSDVIRVHRVISHTIVSVAAHPPDSITLGLDDGTSLVFFEGNNGYESFTVDPGGYVI